MASCISSNGTVSVSFLHSIGLSFSVKWIDMLGLTCFALENDTGYCGVCFFSRK